MLAPTAHHFGRSRLLIASVSSCGDESRLLIAFLGVLCGDSRLLIGSRGIILCGFRSFCENTPKISSARFARRLWVIPSKYSGSLHVLDSNIIKMEVAAPRLLTILKLQFCTLLPPRVLHSLGRKTGIPRLNGEEDRNPPGATTPIATGCDW